MSIHILVPQERLAELLKAEKRDSLTVDGEHEFHPDWPDELHAFCAEINDLLKTKEGLANYLGYEYTVNTDADYFANLEDMLGGEE